MIEFKKQSHDVYLLTQSPEGDLHNDVRSRAIKCFSYSIKKKNSFSFYINHIRFLSRFVKENKINLVYSHLQQANIVSVLAQQLCNARFIICRHHSDSAYVEENKNVQRFDKIINRLGREFIAPSTKVFKQMTEVEKVNPEKIHLIKYAYDFSKYQLPNNNSVKEIREKYRSGLLLIKVARLIPEKRHIILFRVVKKLISDGCDIKIIILSEGYMRSELEEYVSENNLKENIFLLGNKKNVMDYLVAADCVVHVSASEASNNLIKEAALAEKPVIVCRNVGDFDDYLTNNENALLLSKENTEAELYITLKKIYLKQITTEGLGKELKKRVIELFSIEKVIPEYNRLHNI